MIRTPIQVIDRAMLVLDAIESTPVASLSALAAATRLPLSTVARILESLIAHGLVERESGGRSYSLGLRLVALGQRAKQRQNLTVISRPILEVLAKETGEDVGLSVLQGVDAVFLDWVDGPEPLKIVQPDTIGVREDLYYGAFRKVLLAWQEEAWIESYLNSLKFHKYTSHTITSKTALRRELDLIRSQGYAVSIEEKVRHAAAVAAPIFGPDGRLRAAIMTSGPVSRYKPMRIRSLSTSVRHAAARIMRGLVGVDSNRQFGGLPTSVAPKSQTAKQSNGIAHLVLESRRH
jgi:DNA-binding IclR family transcriptional regulator